MIKGITIIFYEREQIWTDELGRPEYAETAEEIENVLVYPASEEEITDTLTLYGRKAVYTLGIPKDDSHTWTGHEVEFFDRRWKVIGDETQGIEDLIPGDWNKKVRVETVNA